MLIILSSIISIVTAYFLIESAWPGKSVSREWLPVKIALSIGIAPGISSSIFFLCLLLFGEVEKHFIIFDVAILVLCGLIYAKKNKFKPSRHNQGKNVPGVENKHVLLYSTFIGIFLLSITIFIIKSLNHPHGSWDAWNIYNLGARFVYRGGMAWTSAFSDSHFWTLPDYPLLLQCSIARSWNYAGIETMLIPLLLAFQYTVASICLLLLSIKRFRDMKQGVLAGMVLLGMPLYLSHGANQVADVPMSFYILTVIVLFCIKDEMKDETSGLILICGMAAGFAAWTKNEGFVLVFFIPPIRYFTVGRNLGVKYFFKETMVYFMGLFPVLMIIIYFKMKVSAPEASPTITEMVSPLTPIFNQDMGDLVRNLTDMSKMILITRVFLLEFLTIAKWMLLPLAGWFLFQGRIQRERLRPGINTSAAILGILLAAYLAVFLLYPLDNIEWLLETTVTRLLIQILPAVIFVFFLFMTTPEENGYTAS